MEAVILAGRPGVGYFPLADCYQPWLFPVANRSLLAHLFDCLTANDVTSVTILTMGDAACLHESTARMRRHQRLGFDIRICTDRSPRGTAGALKFLERSIRGEEFLLFAGATYVTAFDARELLDLHRSRDAAMTVVIEPQRGGRRLENVVVLPDGQVQRFHIVHASRDRRRGEHTPWESAERRQPYRAAGVYVISSSALAHVAPSGYMDLKEQLVPTLRAAGKRCYAFHRRGIVRPLDGVQSYLDLNAQLISADTFSRPAGYTRQIGPRVWSAENVYIARSATITGPVLIGEDSIIGPDTTIVGPVAIGKGCTIEQGASIRASVLWGSTRLQPHAQLNRCIVVDGCQIERSQTVDKSVVITRSGCEKRLPLLIESRSALGGYDVLVADRHVTPIAQMAWGHRVHGAAKRAMDIVLSLAGLVLLSPVYAAIALAVRFDSRGPALYRQRRCGRSGREFMMLKFRTMFRDADLLQEKLLPLKDIDGPMFKMTDDPRVTRLGRILRKTSLDELPQLVNVLRGEMSLVGPRPLVMDEMTFAPRWRDTRLQVKPGISGLWQVNGRSDVAFHDWIKHDTEYVSSRSLKLDLWILMRTVRALRIAKGAR